MSRREGYIVDVAYPLHFHKEMQPGWMAYMATSLACQAPDIGKTYRYCELGCGAGINLLVAAASNPRGVFVGVDFNARHIAQAREAARHVGLDNVRFVEASFTDFAKQDHGRFDFIASHGTWSWLPPQAQASILQIIHDSLNPGGLLYLHYRCYPGSTRLTAIQKVLHEVSLAMPGDSAQAVSHGLALLRQLADAGAGMFLDNPTLIRELDALEKEYPAYVAHDFLSDYWRPQHSADVHRIVAQAQMTYIGSADGFENMDSLSVPGHVQPLLAGLPTPALREAVKDMARDQHQRLDLFQRQPNALSAQQHMAALDRVCFKALPRLPASGAMSFATAIGPIAGPEQIFDPLLRALTASPATFAELRRLPDFAAEPGLLLQALQMLMWGDYVHPLRADGSPADAAGRMDAWLEANAVALRLLPECGTALMQK